MMKTILILAATSGCRAFFNSRHLMRATRMPMMEPIVLFDSHDDASGREDASDDHLMDRRNLFKTAGTSALGLASLPFFGKVDQALAATDSTTTDVLLRLRNIPTFVLVDGNGVPFMIFDGKSTATGYFFLNYDAAVAVLEDAKVKDKTSADAWNDSRIITVPLTVALQLSLRNTMRRGINADDVKLKTFNEIIASEAGVVDAQSVDTKNKDRWAQRGRVPLFSIDGLELPPESEGGAPRQPRYFRKKDCVAEWKKQHPDSSSPPEIQVEEMILLFRKGFSNIDEIKNIVLMPVAEASQKALEIQKATPPTIKYDVSNVVLVKSAK